MVGGGCPQAVGVRQRSGGAQGPRQPSPARYLTTGEASAPPRQHRFRHQDVGRGAPRTSNPTRSRAARHGARPWIRRPLEVLSYRGRATRAGKFSPPTPTPTPTCRLIAAGFATARFPGQACRVQRRAGALACRDEQPRRALYGRLPRSQPGSAPSAGGAKGLCRSFAAGTRSGPERYSRRGPRGWPADTAPPTTPAPVRWGAAAALPPRKAVPSRQGAY